MESRQVQRHRQWETDRERERETDREKKREREREKEKERRRRLVYLLQVDYIFKLLNELCFFYRHLIGNLQTYSDKTIIRDGIITTQP